MSQNNYPLTLLAQNVFDCVKGHEKEVGGSHKLSIVSPFIYYVV